MSAVAQSSREPTALDTTAEVETPEHVRFGYPLAGPTRRTVAYLIDLMIRIGIMLLVSLLVAMVDVAVGMDGMSMGAILVFYFALDWFYFVLFETLWSGRSPGKRALRLRVVGQDGHSLTVLDSVLRNLLRAADFLPFGYAIGLVIMGRDPMFRRFGDMVAGTVVVVEDPGYLSDQLQLHPPPSVQELEAFPARPPVSREELESIELFLRRRGTLAPLREIELAELVAPVIAQRMGLRYQDPVRFLGLVYARARGHEGVQLPAQQPRRRGWRPSSGSPLNQLPGQHNQMGGPS
ncbi:MAG: RDD family protein [Myxococcales bacterium]|nr:RDD family protein [Myxococcales bacterium]MCA9696543.1 RDD family protein [Myxococcales bacterium]